MVRIPLLVYPAKIYLGFVAVTGVTSRVITTVTLPSGASLAITTNEIVLLAGIVLLGTELVTQISPRTDSYINHFLSAVAAVAATVGFIVVPSLGTIAWAGLTMLMWVDVIVGLLVSARLSSGRNVWIEAK